MALAAALLATGSMALAGSDNGRGLFSWGKGDKACEAPVAEKCVDKKCDDKSYTSRGLCHPKEEKCRTMEDIVDPCQTFKPLVNLAIKGKVLDFTFNHGKDYRIYSQALGQKRDLYIYLPPGYDRNQAYPVMFYLHGIF